jgi:hypothetical protein
MTLLETREARELGPEGDEAWESEPKFGGKKSETVPTGNYDDRRPEMSAQALADVHAVLRDIENGVI